MTRVFEKFGSEIAFAEPSWYQGFATAYYDDSHVAYRNKVRAWIEKERTQVCSQTPFNVETISLCF